jgi:hypothetical protein
MLGAASCSERYRSLTDDELLAIADDIRRKLKLSRL